MEPWLTLKTYVGAKDDSDAFVQDCYSVALAQVNRYVGLATVPDALMQRAVLETGAALYQRRKASNNQAQGFVDGSTPVFAAKDPMNSVYALLRPYVVPF